MGLKLGFFSRPSHRVFNYQPLYYDERKERMQERIARANEEAKVMDKTKEYTPPLYIAGQNIRHNFRRNYFEARSKSRMPLIMRIIVLISLVVIGVALYYLAEGLGLLFL